ncbi:MAG: hypothetical protein Q8O93_00525 [bacterium]|nr:hypothetical protein [bacterium]
MKQTIIISLAAALIFFTFGYAVGGNLASQDSGISKLAKGDNTFAAGWEAARRRLNDSNFFPLAGGEIKSFSGQVEAVEGNKIKLKIRPLEPLADPELDRRIAEVAAETKIYELEQKDERQYQQEMEEFNQKMQSQSLTDPEAENNIEPAIPPEPFVKKTIELAEIKAGSIINVSADQDIKNDKSFLATEIIAQMMAPIAVAPPGAD